MARLPAGELVKIRITHRYDEGSGDVREIQFVYDNGAIIGMPYRDVYNTEEFDVPFANQDKEDGKAWQ